MSRSWIKDYASLRNVKKGVHECYQKGGKQRSKRMLNVGRRKRKYIPSISIEPKRIITSPEF